jgi:hypothetical protein
MLTLRREVAMKMHELWRHRETGEVWAVKLVDGVVVGCFGPLAVHDRDARYLDAFDYSPARAAWIEGRRDTFDLAEPTAVERSPARSR